MFWLKKPSMLPPKETSTNININLDGLSHLLTLLFDNNKKHDHILSLLNTIKMTQAEELQLLKDLKDQSEKAKAEIIAKIAALEDAINNSGGTTPEVDTALADLKTSIQGTDDIVPDTTG